MFFLKETFLVYINFTEGKRKTYDMKDLSVPSLVNILVYIYSPGKKIHYTYLKTTEHEMILFHAKRFNEKIRKQLVKICKERKNM